jgi:hypothetical protein
VVRSEYFHAPQSYLPGPICSQRVDPALPPNTSRPLRRKPILAKPQLLSEDRRHQLSKQQSSSLPNHLSTRTVCYYANLANTAQPRSPVASYQARQYIRMAPRNDGYLSHPQGAFTGSPQLEYPMVSDKDGVSWLGIPFCIPPGTINSPPSTDSIPNFLSPNISELIQFEGAVSVAQSFVIAPTMVYYPNLDVTAQPYGTYSSSFNQIHGDVTPGEVAQTSNFDVMAHYPDIQPSFSNQISVDLAVSEAAQNPNFDNFAYLSAGQGNAVPYLDMIQSVADRPESTG